MGDQKVPDHPVRTGYQTPVRTGYLDPYWVARAHGVGGQPLGSPCARGSLSPCTRGSNGWILLPLPLHYKSTPSSTSNPNPLPLA